MNNPIKIGFCVAYDWHLLKVSLPLVYKEADVICLSVDKERIGWDGSKYTWNEEEFRSMLVQVDTEKKVSVVEEDFHLPELSPMENETRQRNMMRDYMGHEGCHVQLDCDEYFLDFASFVKYARSYIMSVSNKKPFNICCQLIVLYKETADGFLYVKPKHTSQLEFIQIVSVPPKYNFGRRNGHFNVYTDFVIVHQSWARREQEILEKLKHWGHKEDFDVESYFQKWRRVNERNFGELRDLHPTVGRQWPELAALPHRDFSSLSSSRFLTLSPFQRCMRNSRWMAKLKQSLAK